MERGTVSRVRQAVRRWWDGEYKAWDIPGVVGIHLERHWTARACRYVVDYVGRHYLELIGILLGVVGLWLAWLTLG